MPCILFLNGPPGVGKDAAADVLVAREGFHMVSFKRTLNVLIATLFGLEPGLVERYSINRDLKDTPSDHFDGRSLRQAQIFVAETVVKPHFGKDFFARRLLTYVAQARRQYDKFVVPDLGFSDELLPFYPHRNLLPIALIRIFRPEYTFVGDSREYVKSDTTFCAAQKDFHNVHNNADQFKEAFHKYYKQEIEGALFTRHDY